MGGSGGGTWYIEDPPFEAYPWAQTTMHESPRPSAPPGRQPMTDAGSAGATPTPRSGGNMHGFGAHCTVGGTSPSILSHVYVYVPLTSSKPLTHAIAHGVPMSSGAPGTQAGMPVIV